MKVQAELMESKIYKLYEILNEIIERKDLNSIKKMDMIEFSLYIGDPNIAPSGWKTIEKIVNIANIDKDSRVLDVGSNSGHSSFILKQLSNSIVQGIDIREDMVELSRRIAKELDYDVNFGVADVRSLPFLDNEFDLIMSSGTLPFIQGHLDKATAEMARVLKHSGLIIDSCIYYKKTPPVDVVDAASEALGSNIPIFGREDYIDLYESAGIKLMNTFEIENGASNEFSIDQIINFIIDREEYLCQESDISFNEDKRNVLSEKLQTILTSFKENDLYTHSEILVFKKEDRH